MFNFYQNQLFKIMMLILFTAKCSEHFEHPHEESGVCYRTFTETDFHISYNIAKCREHASSLPTPFTERELNELVAYAFAQVCNL